MKRINKNTEKKQRVRILATGQLGTVTDQQLMKRDGVLHLDRWFWDDQLAGTKETCRVTFENWDGKAVRFDLEMDYDKNNLRVKMSGRPSNLKEHQGLHTQMANDFMAGITRHGER